MYKNTGLKEKNAIDNSVNNTSSATLVIVHPLQCNRVTLINLSYILILFCLYSNKKTKCYHLNVTFRKSQKLIPAKKQSLPIAKINSRKTRKNRQSAKLNSRKNLVPHGMLYCEMSHKVILHIGASIKAIYIQIGGS